jgi:hypothetical protein
VKRISIVFAGLNAGTTRNFTPELSCHNVDEMTLSDRRPKNGLPLNRSAAQAFLTLAAGNLAVKLAAVVIEEMQGGNRITGDAGARGVAARVAGGRAREGMAGNGTGVFAKHGRVP